MVQEQLLFLFLPSTLITSIFEISDAILRVTIYGKVSFLVYNSNIINGKTQFFAITLISFLFFQYGPFLWMGFNYLKVRTTSRRQFTFYH